jgi:hypothetical protein
VVQEGRGAGPDPLDLRPRPRRHDRDDSFHATDATFGVRRIVEAYTGRWDIEKCQAGCTSSDTWCGVSGTGYDQCRRVA